MNGAHLAAALDQRQDGMFVAVAALGSRYAFLAADERLVGLDRIAGWAAQRRQGAVPHRLADTMAHEPRCVVLDAEDAMKLVAADTLLRRGHQTNRLQPLVQRNVAALE